MDRLKQLSSKYAGYIIAALGILLLAFGYERKQKQDAEASLLTAEADKKDSQLKQQQDDIQGQIKETEQEAKKEEDKPMSTEETVDYLKNL